MYVFGIQRNSKRCCFPICTSAYADLYPTGGDGDYRSGGGIPADRRRLLCWNRFAVSALWFLPGNQDAGNVRGVDCDFPGNPRWVGLRPVCDTLHRCDRDLGGGSYWMGAGGFGGNLVLSKKEAAAILPLTGFYKFAARFLAAWDLTDPA